MNVKEFRKDTGLSQNKFATYFGIPVRTLQGWELKDRNPPIICFGTDDKSLGLGT